MKQTKTKLKVQTSTGYINKNFAKFTFIFSLQMFQLAWCMWKQCQDILQKDLAFLPVM